MSEIELRDATHDGYWKFPKNPQRLKSTGIRKKLSERNYQVPVKLSRPNLEESLHRSTRGLFSYYGCNTNELIRFIQDRNIKLQNTAIGDQQATGYGLVDVLEAADEDPKFEWFTDRPPELRNSIYEFHFADFSRPIYAPTQPPLTRMCRLLRKESMPMFYATSTFVLSFARDSHTLFIPNQLALFTLHTSTENFAAIRHLTIRMVAASGSQYCRSFGFASKTKDEWTLDITIGAEGTDHKIESNEQGHPIRALTRMRPALQEVVQGIVARDGRNRLRKDDIFDLRRAVETGLKKPQSGQ